MEIFLSALPVINFVILVVISVILYRTRKADEQFMQLIQNENLDLECFIDSMLREALKFNLNDYYSKFYSEYNKLKSEHSERKRKG